MLLDAEHAEVVEHERAGHLPDDDQRERRRAPGGTIRIAMPTNTAPKNPPVQLNHDAAPVAPAQARMRGQQRDREHRGRRGS